MAGEGMLEKITANMELTKLKKFKLQKAILTLMLEWKHLEEYMDSTQHSFQECLDDLQRKEDHLNSLQQSAMESNKHLHSVRASIEDRMKLLGDKENLFNLQLRDLSFKEKQFVLIENSIQERIEQVELREEKLKSDFEELNDEEKRFQDIRDSVQERIHEIKSKELQLALIGESLEERIKQFELREAKAKVMFGEFKVEEKRFEEIRESVKERFDEINSKQMELDERSQELDGIQDWIERRVKELDAKEEDFEKRLGSEEKQLSDRVKQIESMGKQLSTVDPTKIDRKLELDNVLVNSSTNVEFIWDGKGLQLFLNQQEKDHNSMGEEVYKILQMSPDPAKLVLDAMEGFYLADSNKGKTEFKLDVIRRSCILLLEQLMRISPQVRPHVKMEAMELVCLWKAKLCVVSDSMEVLGLLYMLASYCLPIPFRTDELLRIVEIVAEHREAPELCRRLGFTDIIPDLIRNLLKKNHTHLVVRFVSEFGLVDEFPPTLLLKGFNVRRIMKIVRRSNSCEVLQDAMIDKKIADTREVLKYIIDHELESKLSPKGIEQCIEELLRLKEDNKVIAPPPPSKPVEQEKAMNESLSVFFNPPSKVPSSSESDLIELGPLANMVFVLANMDGRALQFFLNEHFEDHELIRDVVLLALKHSSDPGRLVLDAMQGFHRPYGKVEDEYFDVSVVRSSCILLLEQLMRLQIHLQPQMKGEAMVIAHHWELTMRDEIENPRVILGFFQFIGAFELTSCFESDELFHLFDLIAQHPHARELCKLLGFSEKKPGCVLHPCVITEGSSIESVPLNSAVVFENVSPAHDSNSLGVDMKGKSEVSICHYISDPAKLVLDAIRGCYHSNFKQGVDFSKSNIIMRKFSSLLEQLLEASPEIKSRVQEEAMAFSVDWKSKLSVSKKNHSEVKAFLLLLATYKLASSVTFEVLNDLLVPVREYKQKFEFFRRLNFTHKTPDFVRYLIEKEYRLLAISFIYEFELVEQFPPVPILKSHLRFIDKLCMKIYEEGGYSSEALDKAADKKILLLRGVITCLQIHKIDCDCTPRNLLVFIDLIKKQKEDRKMLLPTVGSMVKKKELEMKKRAIDLEVQTQQQNAKKRPRLSPPVPFSRSYMGPPPNKQRGQSQSSQSRSQPPRPPQSQPLPQATINNLSITSGRTVSSGCTHCGKTKHTIEKCWIKQGRCSMCGEFGHFRASCARWRKMQQQGQQHSSQPPNPSASSLKIKRTAHEKPNVQARTFGLDLRDVPESTSIREGTLNVF